MRPSHLWKELPPSTRLALADAFWREKNDDSPEATVQHVEAIAAIARRMNFRAKSVQALPIDRKARQLAQMSDVSDAVATRALIAYHFSAQRPLMAAFLNALGVANDNGLITVEDVPVPEHRAAESRGRPARGVSPGGRPALSQDAHGRRRGHVEKPGGCDPANSLIRRHFPWYPTCFSV